MFQNAFLRYLANFYGLLIRSGTFLQSLFILYMRLTWGHQLFLVGVEQFHHISQVSAFFSTLNIGYPTFTAYLVALCEIVGGLFFCIGFASRLAAVPVAIIMLTALSTAHSQSIAHFRFIHEPTAFAIQAPYPYLITALLLFCFGPGKIALDAWLKWWANRKPKC